MPSGWDYWSHFGMTISRVNPKNLEEEPAKVTVKRNLKLRSENPASNLLKYGTDSSQFYVQSYLCA
jgi:hypothetical protein